MVIDMGNAAVRRTVKRAGIVVRQEKNHERHTRIWALVPDSIESLVFIIFAFSFTKSKSPRDWCSFGAFSAFVVALFTEMYGFPVTQQ